MSEEQIEQKPQIEEKKPAPQKKVPVKKKPENKPKVEGRARAKTTIFEGKNKKDGDSNKMKVEGIGQNRFSNLLSMFNKPKEEDNKKEPEITNNQNKPGQLDLNKLDSFKKQNTESRDSTSIPISSGGLSIQERMQKLMQDKENCKTKGKMIDPILEQYNRGQDEYDEDNDNEEEEEENDDDLALSDGENDNLGENEEDNQDNKGILDEVKNEDDKKVKEKEDEDGLGNELNEENINANEENQNS